MLFRSSVLAAAEAGPQARLKHRLSPIAQCTLLAGRGLYASDDAGSSWRAQGSWKGRYTIGLSFNPLRQARRQQQGATMLLSGAAGYIHIAKPHQCRTVHHPAGPAACLPPCRGRCSWQRGTAPPPWESTYTTPPMEVTAFRTSRMPHSAATLQRWEGRWDGSAAAGGLVSAACVPLSPFVAADCGLSPSRTSSFSAPALGYRARGAARQSPTLWMARRCWAQPRATCWHLMMPSGTAGAL